MIFDLFHSVSDPIVKGKQLGTKKVFEGFLSQVQLAESLGMDTVWLAESHFSSEVQKQTTVKTIPEFYGEVGINSDSFQWMNWIERNTKKINLGTAIHNIVGGSGGPIASADRVNTLNFINSHFWSKPRELRIGVAAGRFPYQNTPFGIIPRNESDRTQWPKIKQHIFVEALEIFLRLVKGEALSSKDLKNAAVSNWWHFEKMQLVPKDLDLSHLHIVLGSSCPIALETGMKEWDLDLFNLSFTPPEQIEQLHQKMGEMSKKWDRSRLPRTVLVFIDRDRKKAKALANHVLDTYIEAMKGTAAVPDKAILLQRALVGDASEIKDQLHPENPRKFHHDDRLMLWFEFNQLDGKAIEDQMKYFFEEIVGG
jgi:alkanesulfonate monooxygenase SsuD/methylene tetrahydromethanopterin reductase-like flavin-dependent oxidoreductase (luciferase family)